MFKYIVNVVKFIQGADFMDNKDLLALSELFNEKLKPINERLEKIERKSDSNHNEIMEELQTIKSQIIELDPQNATRHIELISRIDDISKDIKYLKHKTHENEEEIFDIKDCLKAVK